MFFILEKKSKIERHHKKNEERFFAYFTENKDLFRTKNWRERKRHL